MQQSHPHIKHYTCFNRGFMTNMLVHNSHPAGALKRVQFCCAKWSNRRGSHILQIQQIQQSHPRIKHLTCFYRGFMTNMLRHISHPAGALKRVQFCVAKLSNRRASHILQIQQIQQSHPNGWLCCIWRPIGDSNPCYRRERAVS